MLLRMPTSVLNAIGGLGLFLLGMRIMTEGLRLLVDGRLHRWLARVTRTPLSGAVTGMAVTAAIQSSGATTVAAVGFVGAGLLTFEQSLGVIFGANIGSTVTGWLVATFGFKIQLGVISLPLVFSGAILMLFGRRKWAAAGRVIAGFALLFLGLDLLKSGLSGAASGISLEAFQSANISGRLALVGIGVGLTLLTQSSGATVATALAAMDSGILDFSQILAVIIGADIGTTASAWLASSGGTTDSRRTAISHVVYNLFSGVTAFLLLPAYIILVTTLSPGIEETAPEFAAVGFHSSLNILGACLILPFTRRFAALIRWLIPERSPSPSSALDPRLVESPDAAIETLHHATGETAALALECLEGSLANPPAPATPEHLDFVQRVARECRGFVGHLAQTAHGTDIQLRLQAILHALDHIERIVERCRDHERVTALPAVEILAGETREVHEACRMFREALLSGNEDDYPIGRLESLARRLESDHTDIRRSLVQAAALGECDPRDLELNLDAHRWLRRAAWNAFRLCHYLSRG